jgi:hypothetical protein
MKDRTVLNQTQKVGGWGEVGGLRFFFFFF